MSPLDKTMCRLRVSRWMALEAQATFDRLEAAQRGDRHGVAAAEAWAEVCAMRVQTWKEEAER